METPTPHMPPLKVSFLDWSAVPGGYSYEAFTAGLAERLHLLPPFRRRLRTLPLPLPPPGLVEDEPGGVARHPRRGGGGSRSTCRGPCVGSSYRAPARSARSSRSSESSPARRWIAAARSGRSP